MLTFLSLFYSTSILFYMGPETIMPLASILAAVVGIILIFWRFITAFFRRIFHKITGRKDEPILPEPEMPVVESAITDPNQKPEE